MLAATRSFAQTDSANEPFPEKVFISVQNEAKFPGGDSAWNNFIKNNVDSNIATKYVQLQEGTVFKTIKAQVSFIVHEDGHLSNIMFENPIQPELKKEIIRVLTLSPNWIPAEQNGRKVKFIVRREVSWKIGKYK